MLDHEPDTNDSNPATDAPPSDASTSGAGTAAPRRRRAATRKAGPPAVSPEPTATESTPTFLTASTAETSAVEITPESRDQPAMTAEAPPSNDAPPAPGDVAPSGEPAADPQAAVPERPAPEQAAPEQAAPEQAAPAKKATRKRTTKAAEAGTRTPHKRTSKKTAAVSPSDEEATTEPVVPAEAPSGASPTEITAREVAQTAIEPETGPSDAELATATDRSEAPEKAAPDTEAALDELRLALSAELPLVEGEGGVDAAAAGGPPDDAASDDAASDDAASDDAASDDAASDDESNVDDDADENDSEAGDSETDDSETDDSDNETDESGPRRRRRRRGGRRRRRGGSDSDDTNRTEPGDAPRAGSDDGQANADSGTDDSPRAADNQAGPTEKSEKSAARRSRVESSVNVEADDNASEDSGGEDSGDEESAEDGSQRRRRRRRRRRGEDSAPSADDPAEVVVRVREPRSRKQAAQEVTGIEGSTRMEAKRQRRREGREAGRRRAPILSEAEFLARRESVVRKMIIRQRDELSQIAVLEDDILVEHYVDRESAASLIGNVYLGRVQNVLPSMEAAFIDIGRGRNAVLYAGEVDWDAFGAGGQQRKVENVLKSGQTVLVQVTKDPVGAKGARLTSHITLPGRYIVYAPGGHLSGISRKLPDIERKRLKSVLNDLVPESASVIVRTAAEGASEEELVRDVNRLKAQWEDIERKVKQGSAPKLLYGEPDLTVRIVRDLFTEDFAELIIQGNGSPADAYEAVNAYVEHVAPHLHDRMRRWDVEAEGDLFARYRLDEQISKALERKVFLPSGGSLIIDRTEAMTVIDVNTGKFTGSGGNLEATVTSNNLEAAEEIVRQLRLRDIGGIIVIDFIDMVLPNNRELLLRRLVECLGRDRTRHQVAEVTSLGLVQMTRKKIGTGLLEAFTTECQHCHGRGYEISEVPVETQKQPDGGSRDHRGGGGGGRDRGRGRGNQGSGNQGSGNQGSGNEGSGNQGSNGSSKPHHQPIPAALRPDHVSGLRPDAGAESTPTESIAAESTPAESTPADPHPADLKAADSKPAGSGDQQGEQPMDQPESAPQPESTPAS